MKIALIILPFTLLLAFLTAETVVPKAVNYFNPIYRTLKVGGVSNHLAEEVRVLRAELKSKGIEHQLTKSVHEKMSLNRNSK